MSGYGQELASERTASFGQFFSQVTDINEYLNRVDRGLDSLLGMEPKAGAEGRPPEGAAIYDLQYRLATVNDRLRSIVNRIERITPPEPAQPTPQMVRRG